MWKIICAIIVFAFAACLWKGHASSKKVRRKSPSPTRVSSIEDCLSNEDHWYQFQPSKQNKRVIENIKANEKRIKRVFNRANKNIDLSWMNSYEKILQVSSSLNKNLMHNTKKNLEYSKFQYYNSLWFRSVLASDLAHDDCEKVRANIKDLNKLRGSSKQSNSDIDEIISNLKELEGVLSAKVNMLNQNTGKLRDKIGCECGERGKKWRKERMRNRNAL